MAKRIATNNLNASTMDIINVIRSNANYEYQSMVPEVTKESDIPRVGEVLYGNPSLANQFLHALVNRIALVRVKSALFNNAYANLKKGYLEFGETVEEVFVEIAKATEFSVEKAEKREHKRTLPDVRTAFHVMNWETQYPITIQDIDLKRAFTDATGVQDLVAKIVNSVYTAAEYDEYLLFKYLLIKAICKGGVYLKSVGDDTSMSDIATTFRAMSNKLTFMATDFNCEHVHTVTPRENQYIFMDAEFNAKFDVEVLAGAFNMDKANFMGRLHLIDSWDTFDNDRFDIIRKNCDMIEEVTAEELAYMKNVKAVLVDEEWFQIYDNYIKFTDKQVSSGLYWNYWLNVGKTVSSSPFSNIVVVMSGDVVLPNEIVGEIVAKSDGETATTLLVELQNEDSADNVNVLNEAGNPLFVQNETATRNGIAVHKYGTIIIPTSANGVKLTLELESPLGKWKAGTELSTANTVGQTITFTKV